MSGILTGFAEPALSLIEGFKSFGMEQGVLGFGCLLGGPEARREGQA